MIDRYTKLRLLVHEASRWIGVKESGGDNRGQLIEIFQKAVDNRANSEAWCLAFVQYCVKQVDSLAKDVWPGIYTENNLFQTEHCMTLFNKTPSNQIALSPSPGSIVLWQFYKNGIPSTLGHAGIVVSLNSNSTMNTIEGNTSDGSGITREGDGVYARQRSISGTSTMKVKGFINAWPS